MVEDQSPARRGVEYAPGSAIITRYNYERQLTVAGTYRVTSGGNRVRAWNPPRSITRKMRAFVFERDNWTCQLCGRPLGENGFYELDHVTPYRDGGLFIEWNLRAACKSCNMSRGVGGR